MQMETAKRLRDALGACQTLEQFTGGHTHESFMADHGLQLIVQKLLEIVGEALNAAARTDATLPSRIPEFRRIIAMRHRLTHEYDSVDYDVLWSTVQLRIGPLGAVLTDLLEEAPPLPYRDPGDRT